MTTGWITEEGEGATLRLRVIPKASRDAVEGVEEAADGRMHLKVRVRAPADKGAANAAVMKLLAKTLKVPASAVSIRSGHTARTKSVEVQGLPAVEVETRLLAGQQT